MVTFGIVSEYNPFHNGHKYLIDEARKSGATHVVAVMSGNFVQRGETAVIDKFRRAKTAVANGVDLVMEIPVPYVLSSAEFFAKGAVSLMTSLNCIDRIIFGAEYADISVLEKISDFTDEFSKGPELQKMMKQGISYPSVLQKAVGEKFGNEFGNIISTPNNLLAIEYLKALKYYNSNIRAYCIKRKSVLHDSDAAYGEFASASFIRNEIRCGNIVKQYVPESTCLILKEACESESISEISVIENAIMQNLNSMSREEFEKLPEISYDLAGRIYANSKKYLCYGDLIRNTVSKTYTEARVKRLCLSALLKIPSCCNRKSSPYGRILAFNERGCEILKKINKYSKIPVSTSLSDLADTSEKAEIFTALESRATDIFNMTLAQSESAGSDYRQKVTK